MMTAAAITAMTMMTTMTTEGKKKQRLRHELKHQISLREDLVLSQRLDKLFARDKNGGPKGIYQVNSLYFDTPYDSAMREKLDGVNRREKFRLRYYGGELSFIRLEKKFKRNGLCGKESVRILKEQVLMLLNGEYEFLLEEEKPLFLEFYHKLKGNGLRPKTIVRYDREAFFFEPGNVRITLDRNIRTGLGSTDFLNPDIFFLSVMDPITVLEVKYDSFLPDLVRAAVQVPGRQAAACSKYAICRRFD